MERIRKLMHVIELRGMWHTAADVDDSSDLRGITGPGDVAAPSHVHVDTLGNVYITNDDSRLQPTRNGRDPSQVWGMWRLEILAKVNDKPS